MYRQIKSTSAIAVLSVALILPVAANAGGYGSTAVRDGAVANRNASATVPCPRMGQNVPANLAAQMDCGTATPRVAGEPRVVRALQPLLGAIDVETMRSANLQVDRERDKQTPAAAAA